MINIKYDKCEYLEMIINDILTDKTYPFIVNFYTAYIYLHYIVRDYGLYVGKPKRLNRMKSLNRFDEFFNVYDCAKYAIRMYYEYKHSYEYKGYEGTIYSLYPYCEYVKDQGYIIDDVYMTVLDNIWKVGLKNKYEDVSQAIAMEYMRGDLI